MKKINQVILFLVLCLYQVLGLSAWANSFVSMSVLKSEGNCPSGQYDSAGVCIDATPTPSPTACESGLFDNAGMCIGAALTSTCESELFDNAGMCIDATTTPTPSPTPTACESGQYDSAGMCIDATTTPTPSPTPTPTACESGLYDNAGMCMDATTTPTPSPTACESGQVDSAGLCIEVTPVPAPTATPEPAATPTATPEPTASVTPEPTPSATPESTATPSPIPVNISSLSCIKGEVKSSLDINTASLVYETLLASQNIWVEFEIDSQDASDNMLWKLKNYGTSDCSDNTGTVSSDLKIHFSSLEYQAGSTTQDIWADFEFFGENSDGELLWKLINYGLNE